LSVAVMESILSRDAPIDQRLMQVYRAAVGLYTTPPDSPGCMIINTAAVEAPSHPKIAAMASKMLADIEGVLERAFARAVAAKALSPLPSPAARARLAGGVFDTLAVRARLGASASELKAYAQSMVPGICANDRSSR
jgi:TetR/AcrR family transcriptional regulator, copper-responsive repressor